MVQPSLRSRSWRRVRVKTPANRVKMHYRRRKPSNAKCVKCGAALKGTPREKPYKMISMPKTQKRPTRPFAGYYCTKCMRAYFIAKARA